MQELSARRDRIHQRHFHRGARRTPAHCREQTSGTTHRPARGARTRVKRAYPDGARTPSASGEKASAAPPHTRSRATAEGRLTSIIRVIPEGLPRMICAKKRKGERGKHVHAARRRRAPAAGMRPRGCSVGPTRPCTGLSPEGRAPGLCERRTRFPDDDHICTLHLACQNDCDEKLCLHRRTEGCPLPLAHVLDCAIETLCNPLTGPGHARSCGTGLSALSPERGYADMMADMM